MSLLHNTRSTRFICLTAVGLALSFSLSGCSQTTANAPHNSSYKVALTITEAVDGAAYAALAPAAGENRVPLIEALNGLAPADKTFAFANDVNINMLVAPANPAQGRADQLSSILSASGLSVRNAGSVLYVEKGATPAPVAVAPTSVIAPAITPEPRVRESRNLSSNLATATLMSAPVLAPGEKMNSAPAATSAAAEPAPVEAPVAVAPVAAVPSGYRYDAATDSMIATSAVSGDQMVLARASDPAPVIQPAEEKLATAETPVYVPEPVLAPALAPVIAPEPVAVSAPIELSPETQPVVLASVSAPVIEPEVTPAPVEVTTHTVIADAPAASPAAGGDVTVTTSQVVEASPTVVAAGQANEAAQLEATSGVASDVVEPASQVDDSHWRADRGMTLRTVLDSWCSRADVQLVWSTDFDYPLAASITLNDSFEGAVRTLLTGFTAVSPQPVGRLHRQGNNGQRVLIIETRGNLYQEQ